MKFKRLTFDELKTWKKSFHENCHFIEITDKDIALALSITIKGYSTISKKHGGKIHWYILADVEHPYNVKKINNKILHKRTIMVCKPELIEDNPEW